MDDPGLGVVGDNRLPRLMRSILHPRFGAYPESSINPLQNAFARHLPGARDLAYGLTRVVAPQNLRPLDVAESGGSRLAKLIEMGFSPRRSEQASGAWMLVPSTQHSRKQNCMDTCY